LLLSAGKLFEKYRLLSLALIDAIDHDRWSEVKMLVAERSTVLDALDANGSPVKAVEVGRARDLDAQILGRLQLGSQQIVALMSEQNSNRQLRAFLPPAQNSSFDGIG
jgi:hypothetical protein